MPGIRYASRSDSEWRLGNGDPPENLGSAEGQPAVPQEAAVLAVTAKPETVGAGEDARVLARVDRLLSLVNWFPSGPISSWLGGVSDADHSPRTPEPSEILAQSEVPVPARRRKHRSHLIEADLTIPLGVILTSAVAYRVRRPLQKRLGHKAPALEGPGALTSSTVAVLMPGVSTPGRPATPGCRTRRSCHESSSRRSDRRAVGRPGRSCHKSPSKSGAAVLRLHYSRPSVFLIRFFSRFHLTNHTELQERVTQDVYLQTDSLFEATNDLWLHRDHNGLATHRWNSNRKANHRRARTRRLRSDHSDGAIQQIVQHKFHLTIGADLCRTERLGGVFDMDSAATHCRQGGTD